MWLSSARARQVIRDILEADCSRRRPLSLAFRSIRYIDITEPQATEVRIENIFRYANVYQKAIDLVANGKLNLKFFITDTYAMEGCPGGVRSHGRGASRDIKLQITVKND